MIARFPVFATRSTSDGDAANAHMSGLVFPVSVSRKSNCLDGGVVGGLVRRRVEGRALADEDGQEDALHAALLHLHEVALLPRRQHAVIAAAPDVDVRVDGQDLRVDGVRLQAHRILRRRALLRRKPRRPNRTPRPPTRQPSLS